MGRLHDVRRQERDDAAGNQTALRTMSRICGWIAPGVAICSAAELLKPCAQMLPRPRKLAAASAQ